MFGLIAAIISALAGGALSAIGAQQQRKDANKAKDSEKAAAAVKARQLKVRNDAQTSQALREQRAVRGRALAVAADSGFNVGSDDFAASVQQIDANAGLNVDTLDQNLFNDLNLLDSQLQASLDRLNASKPNVLTSTLLGGFQAGATGLAFGSGLADLFPTPGLDSGVLGGSSFGLNLDGAVPLPDGLNIGKMALA